MLSLIHIFNTHQLHTGGIASDNRDVADCHLDDDAFIGNQHDLALIIDVYKRQLQNQSDGPLWPVTVPYNKIGGLLASTT